jgi:hypothetical protein
MGLPWSLYSTFVIEERHGFNKQTLGRSRQPRAALLGQPVAATCQSCARSLAAASPPRAAAAWSVDIEALVSQQCWAM